MIKLVTKANSTKVPVQIDDQNFFTLEVRQPTPAEWFHDRALIGAANYGMEREAAVQGEAASNEYRLQTALVGWEGVETERGDPIPYTWENLLRLAEAYPVVLSHALAAANRMFNRGVSETAAKN